MTEALTKEQLAELKVTHSEMTFYPNDLLQKEADAIVAMYEALPTLIAMAEQSLRYRQLLENIAPAECPTNDAEYNGRMYTCCNACDATLSEDNPHQSDCAWVEARAALENDNG